MTDTTPVQHPTAVIYRIDEGAYAETMAAAETVGLDHSAFLRGAMAVRRWALTHGPECDAATSSIHRTVKRTAQVRVKCARPAGHAGPHVTADAAGHPIEWGTGREDAPHRR